MPSISITREFLLKAVASEIKRQSFGNLDVAIGAIEGVTENGEAFPIVGIRVVTAPITPKNFQEPKPPAGIGKIRLAAVDGVAK